MEVRPERRRAIAIRWIVTAARSRGENTMTEKLAGELLDACERIAREIRSGYTIGYVPPAQDGTYHRVKLEVDPPPGRKLNARTRPGYLASMRTARP